MQKSYIYIHTQILFIVGDTIDNKFVDTLMKKGLLGIFLSFSSTIKTCLLVNAGISMHMYVCISSNNQLIVDA